MLIILLASLVGCATNPIQETHNIELGNCDNCNVGSAGWANKLGVKSAKVSSPNPILASVSAVDIDYQYFTGNIAGTSSRWYMSYIVSVDGESNHYDTGYYNDEIVWSGDVLDLVIDQDGQIESYPSSRHDINLENVVSDWSIDSDVMSVLRGVSPIDISKMSDYRFSDSITENNTSTSITSYPFEDPNAGSGGWPCFYDATTAALIVFNEKIPDCPEGSSCSDDYNQSYWDSQYRIPYLLNCPASIPMPEMPEAAETSHGNH